MAVRYINVTHISRGRNGNAVKTAAYNSREALIDESTGLKYNFGPRDGVEHHEIMLPEGASPRFADATALWSAVEAAENRSDANVARQLIVTLPTDSELSAEERLGLVRSFVREQFTSKGVAAQIDLHRAGSEGEQSNHHAHILVTTRRIEGDELNARKARDIGPEFKRSAAGKPLIVADAAWAEEWAAHQNRFFQERGSEIRVKPQELYPISRKWKQPPLEAIKQGNARSELKREDLEKQSWADHVPSGWRKLNVADIVREMSPKFAGYEKEQKEILSEMHKKEYGREKSAERLMDSPRRVEERWNEMGLARRLLHMSRVYKDLDIQTVERGAAISEFTYNKMGIKLGALQGRFDVLDRRAEKEFERVRPKAEAELERRQKVAEGARHELEVMNGQSRGRSKKQEKSAELML